MPLFLGIHNVGRALTDEEIEDIWTRYKEAAKNHGAEGHKTFYNGAMGRAFCLTEADSAEDVDAAHADIDMPTNELIEVHKLK